MNEHPAPSPVDDRERLLTMADAARVLGISTRGLYRLVASGELPAPLKIGRASRMALTEIHAYIERLRARRHGAVR